MPSGIYIRTEETRRKMRDIAHNRIISQETRFKIGLAFKGKKLSEEHKKKIRENHSYYWMGKKRPLFSNEWKKKISISNKGKKLSEENKKNLSIAKKEYFLNRDGNFKGRKHSEESKKKMRESALGKVISLEQREKLRIANIGKKQSVETIEKRREKMIGEKHWAWKDGITPLVLKIRRCFNYSQWRSDVFTRDNYTCQLCKKRGEVIHGDHYPKSFSKIFYENKIVSLEQALKCEEFWNINNGRTLCVQCHQKTDNYGNRGRKEICVA